MQSLKMQPAFQLRLPVGADQAIGRIRAAIEQPELRGLVASAGRCVDFKIEITDQRFWSPHLTVQLEDDEQGCAAYCRFSPRPEIWTGVMATYFFSSFTVFVAAMYAYAQWRMGTSPWALIAVPIGALLIGLLHLASMIGQSWSADQMSLLRTRLDRTIELAFGESSGSPLTAGEGAPP